MPLAAPLALAELIEGDPAEQLVDTISQLVLERINQLVVFRYGRGEVVA